MYTKFNPELFLEVAELNHLQATSQEYKESLKTITGSYGIVSPRNGVVEDTVNFKITPGTGNEFLISDNSVAIDKFFNTIKYFKKTNIQHTLPTQNQWYWVRVKHAYSPIEKGVVSVSANGTLTGTNTQFTSKLRGQPNFASVIKFYGSANNTQEYQVVRVIDNTTVLLSGSFVAESNLNYSIIGTFTPGTIVDSQSKEIFQYDSCVVEIVAESSLNTAPVLNIHEIDVLFYLARVKYDGSSMIIEDKRTSFWRIKSDVDENDLNSFFKNYNPTAGIESIVFDHAFTTRDRNIVNVSWGVRSNNWSMHTTNRILTLNGVEGGRIKTVAETFDDIFNGWRLYNDKGEFVIIKDSTKQGSQINLEIPLLDPDKFQTGTWIYITPDVEEIEFEFRPNPGNYIEQAFVKKRFSINPGYGKIEVSCPTDSPYTYNVQYRYRNNGVYGLWRALTSDSIGYYSEASFNEDGSLKSLLDRIRVPYTTHASNGFITVTPSPKSYENVLSAIDKGDLRQVKISSLSNSTPVLDLTVGVSEWVQIFDNNVSLATDIVINLKRTALKNGNMFTLIFKGNITAGNYNVRIQDDYINPGSPGQALYQLTKTDISYIKLPNRQLIVQVYCDGTVWHSVIVERDLYRIGDIIMRDNVPSNVFDTSGKGISGEYYGWALCNGANSTPDLRGRFIVGYDNRSVDPNNQIWDSAYNTPNSSGGNKNIQLSIDQLPSHAHVITSDGEHTHNTKKGNGTGGGGFDKGENDENNLNYMSSAGAHDHGGATGSTGSNHSIDIRPPYYTLVYIKRIE